MRKKYYWPPFSSHLWTQYNSLSDLPVLEKNDAKSLWMRIGIGFGLLGGGTVVAFGLTGKLDKIDPMLSSAILSNFLFWVPLFITTGFVGLKQWRYYYGNGSPKDGIFVERIKQASEREMIADVSLSIAGGILIGFCFYPSYWFIMFAIYCFLVIVRCYFTLMRPKYAQKARATGEDVPLFIEDSLNETHNDLLVKGVLAGWVISDALYIIYSVIAFLLCFYIFSHFSFILRFFIFMIVLGVLFYLFLCIVRRNSYRWGLWFLKFMQK